MLLHLRQAPPGQLPPEGEGEGPLQGAVLRVVASTRPYLTQTKAVWHFESRRISRCQTVGRGGSRVTLIELTHTHARMFNSLYLQYYSIFTTSNFILTFFKI